MPNLKDLTGQRFGKLTVIQRASNRGNKVYWLCECDCGNQKEIRGSSLTSNVTKSCGKCNNPNISPKNKEKECPICHKKFMTNINNRKYCYDCSPSTGDSGAFRKRAIKHQLVLYKGGKCEICGYNKCEAALQFHHLNPEEKEFQISDKDLSMEEMKKEVDKCQLLCANCHAEQHYI